MTNALEGNSANFAMTAFSEVQLSDEERRRSLHLVVVHGYVGK